MPPSAFLTTVLTPAASHLLADRAAFKGELQITGAADDDYIDRLLAQASAAVARHCNRVFPVETVVDAFWPERDPYPWQVPGGVAPLQLTRWPIVQVTSVVERDHMLVADVAFRVDRERGQLIRLDHAGMPRRWPAAPIAVTYSGGYAVIPPDLADAVTRMARARWFARRRDPQVRSETVPGVYEAAYWFGAGPGASGGLPPDITDLLDAFRVPVVG